MDLGRGLGSWDLTARVVVSRTKYEAKRLATEQLEFMLEGASWMVVRGALLFN